MKLEDHVLEHPCEDVFQVVPGVLQSVVGKSVLGEVVGADFFGAHPGADGLGPSFG